MVWGCSLGRAMLDNVAAYASAMYQVVSTWNQTPVQNVYVA